MDTALDANLASGQPPGQQPSCALCAPAHEEQLWANQHFRVIAVSDTNYPGYVRVICNRHAAELTDLSEPEQADMMRLLIQIERLMRKMLSPDKINLASLGNQVPHLHWHVIPRWTNDPCFPGSIWSPSHPEQMSATPDQQAQQEARQARAQAFWLALRQNLA